MKFTKLRLENSGTGICVRHSLRSKNSEFLWLWLFGPAHVELLSEHVHVPVKQCGRQLSLGGAGDGDGAGVAAAAAAAGAGAAVRLLWCLWWCNIMYPQTKHAVCGLWYLRQGCLGTLHGKTLNHSLPCKLHGIAVAFKDLFDMSFAAILLTCGIDETQAPDQNLAAC